MMNVDVFAGGVFGQNGYLVRCGRDGPAVAVDPGASVEAMIGNLAAGKGRLEAILLTHAHLDHVEGVARLREVHPEAPIHLHPADRRLYDALPAQAAAFGVPLVPPPPPDRELQPGTDFLWGGCRFEIRFTPGHAPGHVILWSPDDGVAFVGDVVFQGSIGRTDLPGGDFRTLMTSIRQQVLTLPDETVLYTGHGPSTTVGHERVGNPFLIPHYGGELA